MDYKNSYHINQLDKIIDTAFDANEKIFSCLRQAIVERTEELQKFAASNAL